MQDVAAKKQLAKLSSEKNWTYFARKNQDKFKYIHSFGTISESDYLTKWYDIDFWRTSFYSYANNECHLESPDALWSLDILQFPYKKNLVKEPERPYIVRQGSTNNVKPHISVMFAYNAAGDNLEPYFVYPSSFQDTSSLSTNKNQCFASNGYVTSRVLESWLSDLFLPHVRSKNCQKQTHLILYSGKLAILDSRMLNMCKTSDNFVKFFCLTQEKLMPSNVLFQKVLRNRQVDLFKDSWRKTLINFDMPLHFKCSSTQVFFNLFLDAFQNCIEEIDTESFSDKMNTTSSQTTSAARFEKKIIDSFETCELWPIR